MWSPYKILFLPLQEEIDWPLHLEHGQQYLFELMTAYSTQQLATDPTWLRKGR